MPDTPRPTTTQLVMVPAIITVAITALRLIGELQHWDQRFFNRSGGGGGAIVGISWLPFVFGGWFAWRLVRAGDGPASKGRAFGFALLGAAVALAGMAAIGALKPPLVVALGVVCLIVLAGGWVATLGWKTLGRVLAVYALAARVPVIALMLPAIAGKWGTHYDALPPNFPALGPFVTWLMVGVYPQLTLWMGLTLIPGMFVGAIVGAIAARGRGQAVATAA